MSLKTFKIKLDYKESTKSKDKPKARAKVDKSALFTLDYHEDGNVCFADETQNIQLLIPKDKYRVLDLYFQLYETCDEGHLTVMHGDKTLLTFPKHEFNYYRDESGRWSILIDLLNSVKMT